MPTRSATAPAPSKTQAVSRAADILFVLPHRYEDRTQISRIGSLQPGTAAVIEGEILLSEIVFRRRRQLLVRIGDGSGALTLRFFYFSKAQQEGLARGTKLRCHGEVRRGPLGLEIVHPEYRRVDALSEPLPQTMTPIYPAHEGLTQGRHRARVERALSAFSERGIPDLLPPSLLARARMPSLQ